MDPLIHPLFLAGANTHLTPTIIKGENDHQAATLLRDIYDEHPLALRQYSQVAGPKLSFVAIKDLDNMGLALSRAAAAFDINFGSTPKCMAMIAKHKNPCGGAFEQGSDDAPRTVARTMEGNPLAAFGGTFIANFPIDVECANILLRHKSEGRRKLGAVIAPDVSPNAISLLIGRKESTRIILNPNLLSLNRETLRKEVQVTSVNGGFLLQESSRFAPDFRYDGVHKHMFRIGEPSVGEVRDMLFAYAVCHSSVSNTLTAVKDGMIQANAVGQQSRVEAAQLLIALANRWGHSLKDSAVMSDSFFPATDGPIVLIEAKVGSVFTTSGSEKDPEVIEAFQSCTSTKLFMLPDKEARGFHGH